MRWPWIVLLVLGCVEPGEPIASGVVQKQIPIATNRQLDVLLVIDNSPAMVEHQERLLANLRRFAWTLASLEGGLPNLRLGVTTTDLGGDGCSARGDDGVLRGDPDVIGNFLVDFVGPDGIRLRNYQGDLADVLVRIADVGTTGCASTQPLAAARRALENYANRSFLRDTSHLLVLIISAGDAPDPLSALDGYEQFFRSIYDDPLRFVVGGVLGDLAPTATIPQFLDRFPNRSSRTSIAESDWSEVFVPFAQLLKVTLGNPCIDGPLLDIDPERDGRQYSCAVWLDFPVGGRVITPCDSTLAGPCWRIRPDPQACPFADSERFEVLQAPEMPEQAMLRIECLSR